MRSANATPAQFTSAAGVNMLTKFKDQKKYLIKTDIPPAVSEAFQIAFIFHCTDRLFLHLPILLERYERRCTFYKGHSKAISKSAF